METLLSAMDKQTVICAFLEIATGETVETAVQFLQATCWKLEEALQLFYAGNDDSKSFVPRSWMTETSLVSNNQKQEGWKDLEHDTFVNNESDTPPLPIIRETLHDGNAIALNAGQQQHHFGVFAQNLKEEIKDVWESEQVIESAADLHQDNLASLFRAPSHLMFHGPFEKAIEAANAQGKWLLVNLQSSKEFTSHMLNRDTWSNEAVSQSINTYFIFWQEYDDTVNGRKVCMYYKLDHIPVVLVIDPVTRQKMRQWNGMVPPDSLLEDLVPFMDGGPNELECSPLNKRNGIKDCANSSANKNESFSGKKEETGSDKLPEYPPLPEEPTADRSLLCRVGIRLPDGRRVQRNFLKTDQIQVLWAYCDSQLKEKRGFRLAQAIPGAKNLDFLSNTTIGEAGLDNSMISVTWE